MTAVRTAAVRTAAVRTIAVHTIAVRTVAARARGGAAYTPCPPSGATPGPGTAASSESSR